MDSLSVSHHPFFRFVMRGLAILGLVTGLIGVSPTLTTPAQAVDRPAPMSHTIDYVIVSTTGDTSYPSSTALADLTKKVSDHWNRMSRGVVSEIKMGQRAAVPNFPSMSAMCAWTKDTISDVVATALGHSLDVYKGQPNGRTLALLVADCGTGKALATGTSLSSGGIVMVPIYINTGLLAHELGHTFGLYHASAVPQDCITRYWDGPYSLNMETVTPSGCGLGDIQPTGYGDTVNVMGTAGDERNMDLNGQQKYQLGLIQPGAGLIPVTASANEQRITVHDTHTPDLNLPQTIWMTADDPDGPGGCAPPEYGIDYDPVLGGVRVFRVAMKEDCSTRDLVINLSYPKTLAWSVPISAIITGRGATRTYLLPGESRLTQSGNVEVKVVSADPGSGTATVSIRRTDTPGVTSLQVTSNTLGPSTAIAAFDQQLTGKVTTNQAGWSASSNQSWATVTPSGTSGQNITVSVRANPTTSERTATITVRASSSTTTLNLVQQAGNEGLATDCAASTATTCTWNLATPLTGTIDVIGDGDWFRITPTTTGTYVFTSSQGEAPLWYTEVMLFDAAGHWMVRADNRDSSHMRYSAYLVAGETYFLEISVAGLTGDFKLTATTTPSLVTVSPMKLSTPGGPATLTFQIDTSQQWSLSIPSWVSASPRSGNGPTPVTLTVQENITGEARTEPVGVHAGGQAVGVTVTQEYNDDCGYTVLLNCTWADVTKAISGRIDYAGDNDMFRFTVPTTGTWVITSSAAATDPTFVRNAVWAPNGEPVGDGVWVGNQFISTSFLTAGRTYLLKVYGESSARSGNYVVSAATSNAVSLALSPTSVSLPGEGGTETVEVGTNGQWRVDYNGWVTVTPSSGNGTTMVTVSAPPNTTGTERSAHVNFIAGAQTKTLSVTQEYVEGPILSVSPASVNAAGGGESKPVQVTASGSWTATGPAWVTIAPASGSGDKPVTLTVTPNPTAQARTDKVTFTSGTKTATVDITQAAGVIDDCGNTPATACNWSNLGNPVNGRIEIGGDKDWFKITPTVSGTWLFTSSVPTGGGVTDPVGSLYDANGRFIVSHDDISYPTNPNFRVTRELVANTTYYVEFKDWSANATGVYTITATIDDCGPTVDTACTWSNLANPVNGRLEVGGDRDLFKITPTVGGVWTFTSSVPTGSGVTDPFGTLYDTAGRFIVSHDDISYPTNPNFRLTRELVANTTYYVEFRDWSKNPTGAYTITATAPVPVDDCGATPATACTWSNLGNPVNGRIEVGGDKDWFKITPTVSGVWTFTSSVPASGGVTDPVGSLYDANGVFIVLNDDISYPTNPNFRLTRELVANTTYYVEFRDWSKNPTGAYTITATAPVPVDDCGATAATACAWSNLANPVNGRIEVGGDKDWYKFTPTAGGWYKFTSSGGWPDPVGSLFDANGNFMAMNDDISTTNRQFGLTWPLDANKTYYLEVKDYAGNTGSYTVTATRF